MKNIIILLLFISSFVNASYLMYIEFNEPENDTVVRCIDNYYFDDIGFIYTKSLDGNKYRFKFDDMKKFDIKSGYVLDENNNCTKYISTLTNTQLDESISLTSDNLTYLGLNDSDLNLMFSFSGLLLSFLFLFGLFRWI